MVAAHRCMEMVAMMRLFPGLSRDAYWELTYLERRAFIHAMTAMGKEGSDGT